MNGQYGLIQDSDMTFKETLKQAAAEVDTWPRWKREALGVVKALNGAQSLPAEYSAVVDRKFWELIGDSNPDNDEV